MLSYLYEIFMSIVTYILGFFGIQIGKKTVTFMDEVEKKEDISVPVQQEIQSTEHTE
jgi:hypothetical protein